MSVDRPMLSKSIFDIAFESVVGLVEKSGAMIRGAADITHGVVAGIGDMVSHVTDRAGSLGATTSPEVAQAPKLGGNARKQEIIANTPEDMSPFAASHTQIDIPNIQNALAAANLGKGGAGISA